MTSRWGSAARASGRARWSVALAVLGMSAAVALAGCGSSAGATGSGANGPVRAMVSGGGCCETPNQFMFKDVFAQKDVGLNVDWGPITSGGSTVLGLALSGKEDVVQVSAQAVLAAVAAHQSAVVIASVEQGTYIGFSVTKQVADKLAGEGITPRSPLKQRIQALKGLSIWANNPGARDVNDNKMFIDNGVSPKDVKYQYGSDSAGSAAWKSGNVQVYECCDPSVFQMRPDAVAWIKPGEVPELMADVHLVWATTQSYAQAHPDVIKKLIKGMNATTTMLAAAKPGTPARQSVLSMIDKEDPGESPADIQSSFNENWANHVTILNPIDCKTMATTIADYNAGQPASGAKVTAKPQQVVASGALKNDC